MTNMKKKMVAILSILVIIWGCCYYYEIKVTKLIHASLTRRSIEMTDDAARIFALRLQKDGSAENIKLLKYNLKSVKTFGAAGRMHLVDSKGNEVMPEKGCIAFSGRSFLPAIMARYPEASENNFLTKEKFAGVYDLKGVSYTLTYKPVGVNDWYIMAAIPLDNPSHPGQQAVRQTFKLVVALIIIFGIIALYVIYELRDKQSKLYTMAYCDDITGLGNKNRYFAEMHKMAKNKNSKQIWCLILLNIHNFRWVNDIFGLQIGNEVLRKVGNMLQANYTSQGEVAMRLSADVFLLLKPIEAWQEPTAYVENILEDLGKITVNEKRLNLKAAVGGVLFRAASVMDGHTVLDAAVHMRVKASEQLESPIVFCTEDVVAQYKEDNALLEDLKKDIQEGKLEVFYQAKYNPSSNEIIGAEALLRWKHATKGYIPPGLFIPLAEKRGIIWPITQLVFTKVCADIQSWRKQGRKIVPISVNISTHDLFQSELFSFLLENINKYDITPGDIELEITETSIMFDLKIALDLLRQLKQLGFKLDIDDFGTGYSALSYLQEGVFDVIKLDRSFLLQRDKFKVEGEKLITSIVAMGKSLGLICICEGAETKEHVDFLREIKVDGIQGYFYAKPEPENEFRKRLP